MARTISRVVRKGVPHKLTASRAAQIHRWQMLGAAARKGKGRAAKANSVAGRAKERKQVLGSYGHATKWGLSKLILPTSLVTPFIPGYQIGDRHPGKGSRKRKG